MRTLFLLLFGFAAVVAQAQTQKIGYADYEYIFSQMPESKQIESEMKTHNMQLDNQMKAKVDEYTAKVNAYKALPANTPDAIKKDKEAEINQLGENYQRFQQDAQSSVQKKNADLMEPVFKKIGKAIEAVAKENGYSFIITSTVVGGGDVLLYSDEAYNISALVLKKWGITPTAAAPNTPVPKPGN